MMKPIHKFNGGNGATLCHRCNRIISIGLTDDLYCIEHGGLKREYKYYITRHDGLSKSGNDIKWVEWNEDSSFKDKFDTIAIGRSMVLDFNMGNFKWMTTQVTEILESTATYIKFKTKNSEYELYTIEHDSKTTDRETTTA